MMIDPNLTPTEAEIPTLDSTESHVLSYSQVALICGCKKHREQVATFVAEWLKVRS